MEFNRWWEWDSAERFWLEITDRDNLGDDLNAPQQRDDGAEYYGYSLIKEIADGDVIFHYHKERRAIVALSQASGHVSTDRVMWGAHGTTARSANVQPYDRDGWRLNLCDFRWLETPRNTQRSPRIPTRDPGGTRAP